MAGRHSGQKRQVTFTRRMITETEQVGPESGGPQFCIRCHRSILRGERWVKVMAADNSYGVAVCDSCRKLAQAGEQAGGAG